MPLVDAGKCRDASPTWPAGRPHTARWKCVSGSGESTARMASARARLVGGAHTKRWTWSLVLLRGDATKTWPSSRRMATRVEVVKTRSPRRTVCGEEAMTISTHRLTREAPLLYE